MSWIQDVFNPKSRSWEEVYRNRWAHDRVVRSTHGVNCTGGCSWNIYVKQGLVAWEYQALDYPRLDPEIPSYEPRGCQRGMSQSWYVYSALRVKYPYVRGALLDRWNDALAKHSDPIAAWESIVTDDEARAAWQQARGKGGFRRVSWNEVLPMLAAANLSTARRHGPDRVIGFSPIPAMSMISYAAGARYLQLLGGVCLSFYDWYCDLPPASPEVWGEQTDVGESADWYKSRFIAVVGSNVLSTRTPDAHFLVEARHQGAKVVVFAPDFSQTSKIADEWVPLHQGQDGAFWMAVGHVLLKEFHADRRVPYFDDYLRRYSDAPMLVELIDDGKGGFRPGPMLRASAIEEFKNEDLSAWKLLVFDEELKLRMPRGTVGHRWQKKKGEWNLAMDFTPRLTLAGVSDEMVAIGIDDFSAPGPPRALKRVVPARRVMTLSGSRLVATAFDILLAQYGIGSDYNDATQPFTPAWQERFTGVAAADVIRFAREWGRTAETTRGRCMVIIGAGVNHWYHNNLIYRACITALMVTGCIGRNGGGWNHYVGQEKLAPAGSWAPIAFGLDWGGPARLQNTPSFHYMHSDQWRYDRAFTDVCAVSDDQHPMSSGHTADRQAMAIRNGWLPCFPQFDRPNHEVLAAARNAGARSAEEIGAFVSRQLRARTLHFSMEDPDNPRSWPRIFYIWRGNALQASAKGHEYFLKHYLGTDNAVAASEDGKNDVHGVAWRDNAPKGKLDLIVDINFRMDTSALYSDVVLPAASWYEKDDLNTTDLHSYIHPLQKAVPPCWESKSDWQIFRALARKFSELAVRHFPRPVRDIVAVPLAHDSAAEIAQPEPRDWFRGECEAVPGKTMPQFKVVERDYANVYKQFISFGPAARANGLGAHGTHYAIEDFYDEMLITHPTVCWTHGGTGAKCFSKNGSSGCRRYPSLEEDEHAVNVVLHLATVTNGELAWRSYKKMEEKVGLPLAHLVEKQRGVRTNYADLQARPHRFVNSPMWSGLIENGRAYSPFTYNVECLVPWRTLTGRQHLYLDHPTYIEFGEHLPTYKPKPLPVQYADTKFTEKGTGAKMLNYLTPHGKWHIHSTYGDNQRMTTLSRGVEPFWMSEHDAAELGIADNDWVEVFNDHGVVVTRAAVSRRIPRGICIQYHSPERTYSVPKSPLRGNRRAGGHNSLTRTRLKPNLMIGGYGQFTFHFNYWGPTGCNRDTHVMVRKLSELKW